MMNELLYFGSIIMSIMSILQMASAKYNRIIQNPPDLSQKYTENVNSLTASLVQLGFNLLALTSSWIPGSWSLRHGHSRSNNQCGLKTVNPEEFSAADSFSQRWEGRTLHIHSYEKSSFLMRNFMNTHYKWLFTIAMLNYQRVSTCNYQHVS